jgi:hypothetical protein
VTRPTNNIEARILGISETSTTQEAEAAYKAYTERMAPRGTPLREAQKAILTAMTYGMDGRKLEGLFKKKEEIELEAMNRTLRPARPFIHQRQVIRWLDGQTSDMMIIDDPYCGLAKHAMPATAADLDVVLREQGKIYG